VDLGEPLVDALMRPTRIYVPSIVALLAKYRRKRIVGAMAHITGGGLAGNLPRVIPPNCDVEIARGSWPTPPIFRLLEKTGIARAEMYRVFNMGIGFVLVVRPAFAGSVAAFLGRRGETVYRIGQVRRGDGRLRWR
jgi:phosphoribosylformylglycinamidine cyclo-ligase